MPIQVIQGNILDLDVDCIVNPTNPALAPGGGLSGAIHRAAGQNLYLDILNQYPLGLHTGEATRPMPGHLLKAKFVIHTVGPRINTTAWFALLRSAYLMCLTNAQAAGIKTIALPLVSAGIFGIKPADSRTCFHLAADEYELLFDNITLVEFK